MGYIVLARKYRPQRFADLVGQQHIAKTLKNAILQNRVAHAFLFTGSRGVGKTSSARIFAKALNCHKPQNGEPCNECLSCREITDSRSIDVIEMDAASNRGINEIQDVLESVKYAPARDRYKIFIIDEVHMLTNEAFNALLKTLEEPPAHIIFIFATTDPNKIPVTILSRCQRYDFKRIPVDELVAHLRSVALAEGVEFEDSALRLIARNSRGGVRDSLSAMDQIIAFAEPPISGDRASEVLGVAGRETLMKFIRAVLFKDIASALAVIRHVDGYGQDLRLFAFDVLEALRDVTVLSADHNAGAYVELDAGEQAQVLEWAGSSPNDRLQRLFNIWYQASEQLMPRSLTPRLLLEVTAVKMCQTDAVVPLDGILRKLDFLTQTIAGGNIPADALAKAREFLGMSADGASTQGNSPKT